MPHAWSCAPPLATLDTWGAAQSVSQLRKAIVWVGTIITYQCAIAVLVPTLARVAALMSRDCPSTPHRARFVSSSPCPLPCARGRTRSMVCKRALWAQFERTAAAVKATTATAVTATMAAAPAPAAPARGVGGVGGGGGGESYSYSYWRTKHAAEAYHALKQLLLATPRFRGWLVGDPQLESFQLCD
jgi:hypothetical protein